MYTQPSGTPLPSYYPQPVAGDLVVRELPVATTAHSGIFLVAIYPSLNGGSAHRTFQGAVELAHTLAVIRGDGVHVWRELSGRTGASRRPDESAARRLRL